MENYHSKEEDEIVEITYIKNGKEKKMHVRKRVLKYFNYKIKSIQTILNFK